MTLEEQVYKDCGLENVCLATISDFNSLIAKSQENQTPVYALTAEQIGQRGNVLEITEASRDNFLETFSELADKVIALVDNASSH